MSKTWLEPVRGLVLEALESRRFVASVEGLVWLVCDEMADRWPTLDPDEAVAEAAESLTADGKLTVAEYPVLGLKGYQLTPGPEDRAGEVYTLA